MAFPSPIASAIESIPRPERRSIASAFEETYVDALTLEPLVDSNVMQCGHSYQKTPQIVEWIRDTGTCPQCRKRVSVAMPKNYYANSLYATAKDMAIGIDKLSASIQDLRIAHTASLKRSSIMEMSKNVEIQDLRRKAQEVFDECERLKVQNAEMGHQVIDSSNKFLEQVQQNSILTLENGVLRIENQELSEERNTYKQEVITLRKENNDLKDRVSVLESKPVQKKVKYVYLKSSSSSGSSKKRKRDIKPASECPVTTVANCVINKAYECMPCLKTLLN